MDVAKTADKKEETKPTTTQLADLDKIKREKHPPDPTRFEEYKLAEDGKSFTIKTSSHVFTFDEYNGWTDEWGNYYNKDAVPCSPPRYGQEEEDSYDDYDSEDDDLAGEYDNYGGDVDPEVEERNKCVFLDKANDEILQSIPADAQNLTARVRNIPFWDKEDDFMQFIEDKGIEDAEYRFPRTMVKGEMLHNGTCTVRVANKAMLEKLADLNGVARLERKLQVELDLPDKDRKSVHYINYKPKGGPNSITKLPSVTKLPSEPKIEVKELLEKPTGLLAGFLGK